MSPERVARFRAAVGSSGPEGEVPPTFATCYRSGEFELMEKMAIELNQVLHAEQEYHYETLDFVGAALEYETTLSQAIEKKGGSGHLHFLVFDTRIFCVGGEKSSQIGVARTTLVVRKG